MIRMIVLILFLSSILVACSNDNEALKPNSPQNTTSLMKMYALQDNYEEFKSLFLNGTDAERTQASFNQLKGIATSSSGINSFTLLTFDNGEMVLVQLIPIPNQEGKVLIQNVIKVPEEMKVFIRDAITPLH
jgi:hypothetical protein